MKRHPSVDQNTSRAAVLRQLEDQAREFAAVIEAAVGVVRERFPSRDDVDTLRALSAQARCLHEVVLRHGGHAPAPVDVITALRTAASNFVNELDAAAAEQIETDPEIYADEVRVLSAELPPSA